MREAEMIKHLYPDINKVPIPKVEDRFWHSDNAISRILKEVSQHTGVPIYQMRSKSRKQEFVEARALFVERAFKKVKNKSRIMRAINRDPATFYNYKETWL